MKKDRQCWIRHTHLFGADEYQCPFCGHTFRKPFPVCPDCGKRPSGIHDPQDWVDEAAEAEWILGDK